MEAGFIAAANLTSPANIVCVNIHGLIFKKPVPSGSVIRMESRVVLTGTTRIVSYVKVFLAGDDTFIVDGFLTFVHVDHKGKPRPHGISFEALDPETKYLQDRARDMG